MGAVLLIAASFWAWAGTVTVEMLDIGQGDSILIRTPANKTILIDAGDGKIDVAPMLKELGVDHLDLIVATHPHADHIGGMDEVLEAFPPKIYVDNGLPHTTQTYTKVMALVESTGADYRAAVSGTVFNLDDGAKLEILLPGTTHLSDTRSDLNSNSVVTRLTHGKDCFLFTGDAEEPTERLLLDQGITACEVLKVAHHGSRHSSSAAFLSALQPNLALISLGADNRYSHPGGEAVERLVSAGARVFRTDLQGRITVASSGEGVTVTTERSATDEELRTPGDVGLRHAEGGAIIPGPGPRSVVMGMEARDEAVSGSASREETPDAPVVVAVPAEPASPILPPAAGSAPRWHARCGAPARQRQSDGPRSESAGRRDLRVRRQQAQRGLPRSKLREWHEDLPREPRLLPHT